jgi:hypothetical protein
MRLKRWGVGRKVDRERTVGGESAKAPRCTCKQRRTQLEGQGRGEGGREECFLTIFPTDKRGNFVRDLGLRGQGHGRKVAFTRKNKKNPQRVEHELRVNLVA